MNCIFKSTSADYRDIERWFRINVGDKPGWMVCDFQKFICVKVNNHLPDEVVTLFLMQFSSFVILK